MVGRRNHHRRRRCCCVELDLQLAQRFILRQIRRHRENDLKFEGLLFHTENSGVNSMKLKALLLFLALACALSPVSLAQAQDGDDSYDPFADYSEFDQASEEEADINFFRNGRFLTVGLVVGQRAFTQDMAKIYSGGTTYGLYLSYFFDLRLAFQFGFKTADNAYQIDTNGGSDSGNVNTTLMSIDLKYYFNTQNVTKGLANLNPYILGGFSQAQRTLQIAGGTGYARDSAMGVDVGLGIEIPLLRRKAYFGFQGTYHMLNFPDESKPIQLTNGFTTSVYPRGDMFDVLGILGANF